VLGLLAVAGATLHAILANEVIRLAWGVFALTVATVTLVMVAVTVGRARAVVTRTYAAVTIAAAGLWLVTATITGVGVAELDLTAGLIGIVICLCWNVRGLLGGQGEDHHGGGQWSDMADEIRTLRGTIRARRIQGATMKATVQLPPGMTAQDAQADLPRIAALAGVPATGARMTPDPDDASRVEISVTPEDMLKNTIPWPGPRALAGASIAEPIELGQYEDALELALRLPGIPGRQAMSHILLIGMTGSGKSELLQVLVAAAACRGDVEIDYLDVAGKAAQTVGPIRAAIRELVTEKPAGAAYLQRLLGEVPGRAGALASAGMREWQAGAPVPYRIVVIDEGASLVSDSDVFVELARTLRSVGVQLVLALQRATFDQVPTSARANFGTVLCFGVRAAGDAKGALSPEVRDSGATPEAWRNRKPGYLYCEAPGIDDDRCAMPARAYLASAADVQRIIGEATPYRYPGADTGVAIPGPAETRAAAGRVLAEAVEAEATAPRYTPPGDLAAAVAQENSDEPLAAGPGMDLDARLGPPPRTPPLTASQAEQALDEFLAAYRDATGGAQFQRRDLIGAGVLDVLGRRKSWLSGALGQRVAAGVLVYVAERCDGIYGWAPALSEARR